MQLILDIFDLSVKLNYTISCLNLLSRYSANKNFNFTHFVDLRILENSVIYNSRLVYRTNRNS